MGNLSWEKNAVDNLPSINHVTKGGTFFKFECGNEWAHWASGAETIYLICQRADFINAAMAEQNCSISILKWYINY